MHSLMGVEHDEFRKKAPNDLKKTIKQIDALRAALQQSGIAVADSAERFTLIASAKERIGAITANPDSGQSNLYYPGLNWLLLEALANLNKPAEDWVAPTAEQAARLKFCRENAEAEDRSNPDFYSLNAQFDAIVVEGMLSGTLAAQTDTAIALFKRAWLMMVSTAIVDLPVARSPMINSRCPRPIGTIASMAMIPVWTG